MLILTMVVILLLPAGRYHDLRWAALVRPQVAQC